MAVLLGVGLLVGGCSSSSLSSMTGGLVGSDSSASGAASTAAGATPPPLTDQDIPCPDTAVRAGATTLIVGNTAGQGEPSPLDVRYQGSIERIDRECRVVAGAMHIKVGVVGRVITGPAGGPGSLNVPLRVAVVREGVNPVTITTELVEVPVTIAGATGNVTFTHIYPDVSFPLPSPIGWMDYYKVYVGFDAIGAQQQKKRPTRRRAPRR